MSKEDIEAQIRKWQRSVEKYNGTIYSNNLKIEELEDIIIRLTRKAEEMETGLDGTMRLISSRLSVLNGCEKFKTNYSEQVKNILYNSSTNSAITETRQAITKIKNECYRLDSDNDVLYGNIYYANQQIEQLRERLRTEMMNCE